MVLGRKDFSPIRLQDCSKRLIRPTLFTRADTLSQMSLPSPEFGISSHSSEVSGHPILGHPKAPPGELVPQSRPKPANRNHSLSISALPSPKMWLIHRWASTFGAQPTHHRPDTPSRPTSRVRLCPYRSQSTMTDDSSESTTIRPSSRSLESSSLSNAYESEFSFTDYSILNEMIRRVFDKRNRNSRRHKTRHRQHTMDVMGLRFPAKAFSWGKPASIHCH
ncbi:uncharacterized protein CCOS01_01382 [Colletotrichum costaricense]|uniref:Uncharacterized protein n=1 Tax=Colletotrichum costaricense TaxID=1209916 RepID=A0AAI9ZBB2_9PEZI|nr:uncharacterized protein CCOS01_01382 [Colletotrichum costaricense]KAK1540068.1 hypothetical protein CCOS01_01382 [Colletotrichum costaricense]